MDWFIIGLLSLLAVVFGSAVYFFDVVPMGFGQTMLVLKRRGGGFNIKGIVSLVVYITILPLIMTLLDSLSGSLSGTAGTLLSAIISLVPVIMVMKLMDKLNF